MNFDMQKYRPKYDFKTAFIAVFVIGLIAHIYKFTNMLPNHDALYSVYSGNDMVGSGRWFLKTASALSSVYDLPWINGFLSLLWIALSAGLITEYFEINDKASVVICSGLLVSFPCVVNTFLYEFTADAYFLSMFLATCAAQLSRIGCNKVGHMLLASLCVCLSCGIYQAYVSFSLMLAICHLMLELLRGERENREYYRWIVNQVLIYAFAFIAYFVLWKVCLAAQDAEMSGGLSDAMNSAYNMDGLLLGFATALRTLAYFFLSRNVFAYGWTKYAVMNVVFIAFLAVLIIAAVIKRRLFKNKAGIILFILCLVAIPVFSCIWSFASPGKSYHLLMLQSLSVLYIFCLVLANNIFPKCKKVALVLLAIVCFKFTVQANQVYFEMNMTMERSKATATEMMTRVHLQDEGQVERIALVGSDEKSLVEAGFWAYDEIWVNAHQIKTNLVYDNTYGYMFLNQFSISHYYPVSEEELSVIEEMDVVKQMPEWPMKGSVKVIEDVAVIKLS